MTYTIQDCTPGTSWACEFRVTTWLDHTGTPTQPNKNLNLGETPTCTPGEYSSLGIIRTRDLENLLVELEDTQSDQVFVVAVDDCWAFDRVEYADE